MEMEMTGATTQTKRRFGESEVARGESWQRTDRRNEIDGRTEQ